MSEPQTADSSPPGDGAAPPPSKTRQAVFALLFGIVSTVGVLAVGEIGLRLAIRSGGEAVSDPALYTHPFCNDDYHKLRYLWSRTKDLRPGTYVQDPLLGWVPDRPQRVAPRPGSDDDAAPGPLVGLFGDSFTAGVPPAPEDERIGPLLEQSMPAGTVADWSVAGYGVGQIYLRFRQALAGEYGAGPEEVVIGILQDDVDRIIERFRAGPKPYFELVDDRAELRGVPIEATPEEWLEENPVRIRSYLKALLQSGIRKYHDWQERKETDFENECLRGPKEVIGSQLLGRILDESRAAGIEPLFVLFYSERAIQVKTWREDFLLLTLSGLGAEFIDTKALLLAATEETGTSLSDFFFPIPNGHLNTRGNDLVARAIYHSYRPDYGWPETVRRAWKLKVELGRAVQSPDRVTQRGWADDGDFFSWTTAPTASVRIEGPIPADRDLVLQLDTQCALRTADDDRLLTVRFNGTVVGEFPMADFPDCWAQRELRAPIPVELLADGADGATIELGLPSLLTPGEAGYDLSDERLLGLALSGISLRETR